MKLNYTIKITLFIIFFITNYGYTQAPVIEWQECIGGTNSDAATSIQQTSDGGYIVAGNTYSNDGNVSGNHGGFDYLIIKTNFNGTIEWQKCIGGSFDELAYKIQQTSDGGYIVAGRSNSTNGDVSGNHGGNDFLILKLSSNGIIEWQKCFGGSLEDVATSIQQTSDGGYIVAGFSNSTNGDVSGNHGSNDFFILKLTSDGMIEWQKCIGGTGYDYAYGIQQTTEGGYIVAGYSNSIDGDITGNHGSSDYLIVKLNSIGTIEWQKSLGGLGPDNAYSIQQTTEGGYIVTGQSNSFNGDVVGNHGFFDVWVVKLSSYGIIEWQNCFGGSLDDIGYDIQQTIDGGYILVGSAESTDGNVTGNHGGEDVWILKLNSNGIIQWKKCIGGNVNDLGRCIKKTNDGGYIIAATTGSNNGNVTGNHGSRDVWIVKLSPDNLSNNMFNDENRNFTLYPNPAHDNLILKLDYYSPSQEIIITDIQGKIIKNQMIEGLTSTINTSSFEKGIYFLTLFSDRNKTTKKFIVE